MQNQTMIRKIKSGQCRDIGHFPQRSAGIYVMRAEFYRDGLDYCVLKDNAWVYSIGVEKATGEIHAATDGRFYENPEYDCIWLR
jgi:hypothetical protein